MITPIGMRNGEDCANKQKERRVSSQEEQGMERISQRLVRNEDNRGRRRKEWRGSRKDARGAKKIALRCER